MTPTVGVLALQGDVADHIAMMEATGARAVAVRRQAEIESVDGLIIPGGESTTMSRLLQVFDLFDPLDVLLKDGLPVYGSCAGMIMLASEVWDGRPDQRSFSAIPMTVRRNAFGRQVDSFEAPISFARMAGGPYPGVFIRAPWVESVSGDTEVLGTVTPGQGTSQAHTGASVDAASQRSEGDRIVAVRSGSCLATSFHPEMTQDNRVHEYFLSLVRAART